MKAFERLLNYVKIFTTSDETTGKTPSSDRQWNLANRLADELKTLGLEDVRISEYGYVYASLPATAGHESDSVLGLIAHMDTSPDFSGEKVNPVIHADYDGQDVTLGTSGRVLKVSDFPELATLKGRTLITTDGTTLLGADDKAGIAEIMTVIEQIQSEKLPHGKLCFGFTPDEEIGEGADHFDLAAFGADYAYTVDGGPEYEFNYETFNAAAAKIKVNGVSVHPGEAKNRMVNAGLVACEFNAMLPAGETPRNTADREGFFHLIEIKGDVNEAEFGYIIRDHDIHLFEGRKESLRHIAALLNEKYGAGTVELTISDTYMNMAEIIAKNVFLIDRADAAMRKAGVEPVHIPVRGGTDGSRLSYMGLPCPNFGTGGYAYHGPMEHITVEAMDKVTEILLNLIEEWH